MDPTAPLIPPIKDGPEPVYVRVKQFIRSRISSGGWPEGFRLPSEPDLAKRFQISRMTVNRAMRDLTSEGVIERISGVGTFVKKQMAKSTFLEIRNIGDEIRERGHQHMSDVRVLEKVKASQEIAERLEVSAGEPVFHSTIVHKENGTPIQVEDRFVNPDFAPEFLMQDFTKTTPTEYLLKLGPLDEVEHIIKSVKADDRTRSLLAMDEDDTVLLLKRRTWSGKICVTVANLLHPGSSYSLMGRFSTNRTV